MAISPSEIKATIKALRGIIDGLERKLGDSEADRPTDPYQRRKEILQEIYWSRNRMSRDELMALLREKGTNYAWIGQQVKKQYLIVTDVPGGGTRYSVTRKAVREERLDDERAETDRFSRLSMESFAEDWDNDEDAIYDEL
jgi:hypothetical protein